MPVSQEAVINSTSLTIATEPSNSSMSVDPIELEINTAIEEQLQLKSSPVTNQNELMVRIEENKPKANLLIGGFLQPSYLPEQGSDQSGLQISSLLTELKISEQTNQLANMQEQVEQTELARQAEESLRKTAEEKLQIALHQTREITRELHDNMSEASIAKASQEQDKRLRDRAELKSKEAVKIAKRIASSKEILEQQVLQIQEKTRDAQQNIRTLRLSVNEKEQLRDRMAGQLQKTVHKIKILQKRVYEKEQQVLLHKEKIPVLHEENQTFKSTIAKQDREINLLKEQMQVTLARANKLQAQIDQDSQNRIQQAEKIDHAYQKMQALQLELKNKQMALELSEQKIYAAKQKIHSVEALVLEKDQQISKSNIHATGLQKELGSLETKLQSKDQQIVSLEQKICSLGKEASIQEHMYKQKLDIAHKETASLQTLLDTELASVETKLHSKDQQISSLEQKVCSLGKEASTQEHTYKQKLDIAHKEAASLQTLLDTEKDRRKKIDEKAKIAIAKANQSFMELLNTSLDEEVEQQEEEACLT